MTSRTLALFALFLAAPLARAEHYDIYILAGQSNMDGRGPASGLTGPLARYAEPQKDVQIDYGNPSYPDARSHTDGFVPLRPGFAIPPLPSTRSATRPAQAIPTAEFGPELSFGRAIADADVNKHVRLIKFAKGGTSLEKDWDPTAKGKLHDGLVAHVNNALKLMRDHGDTYAISGFIWHQGESDSKLPAATYRDLLTAFIKQVRTDLNTPDCPVVLGECYDNGKRAAIREAQLEVATAVPNVYFATSANLKTWDNGTHFDAASQITMGLRMAKALLEKKSVLTP